MNKFFGSKLIEQSFKQNLFKNVVIQRRYINYWIEVKKDGSEYKRSIPQLDNLSFDSKLIESTKQDLVLNKYSHLRSHNILVDQIGYYEYWYEKIKEIDNSLKKINRKNNGYIVVQEQQPNNLILPLNIKKHIKPIKILDYWNMTNINTFSALYANIMQNDKFNKKSKLMKDIISCEYSLWVYGHQYEKCEYPFMIRQLKEWEMNNNDCNFFPIIELLKDFTALIVIAEIDVSITESLIDFVGNSYT